ncbi:MAG: GyrI-like domain-containing protein [Neobacillus sp.]|jgi:AraC family transcriptional regulator
MGIKVIEKPEMKVVGISWNGPYSELNEITKLFNAMESRLNEVSFQTGESIMVAPLHIRETELTYYVTAPVDRIENIPEGMVGFSIPQKNYVFATHVGRLEEVENTYSRIFEWMKDYGYELDEQALSLQIYKPEHKEENAAGKLHFEILLPVKCYKY